MPTRTTLLAGLRTGSPPNPAWLVLALLILAALGALVAAFVSRGGGERETLVATHLPARTVVHRRPIFGTETVVPTPVPPVVNTTPPPTTAPSRRATTLRRWSAADGYTVVLASIPRANGRSSAVEVAKQALAKGLATVGVLDTNDFSSLHPGYFVVFSGYYRSSASASTHVAQAEAAGFPAYERRITR